MKVIVCIDERGGVCFHGRRVSQDRQQREDVLIHYGEFLCWKDQLEELVIYKWNRTYPFDEKLSVPLDRQIWDCIEKRQFSGSSHEKIDVEHYIKRR